MTATNQQRDAEIRRLRANGEPPAKIAKKFGVSGGRISQIAPQRSHKVRSKANAAAKGDNVERLNARAVAKVAKAVKSMRATVASNERNNRVSGGIQPAAPSEWEIIEVEVSPPQTEPAMPSKVELQSLLTRYLLQAVVDTASAHSTAERIRLLDNLIVEFARLRNEM